MSRNQQNVKRPDSQTKIICLKSYDLITYDLMILNKEADNRQEKVIISSKKIKAL